MSNCPSSHEIQAFIEGGLNSSRKSSIQRHLAACADCAAAIALAIDAVRVPPTESEEREVTALLAGRGLEQRRQEIAALMKRVDEKRSASVVRVPAGVFGRGWRVAVAMAAVIPIVLISLVFYQQQLGLPGQLKQAEKNLGSAVLSNSLGFAQVDHGLLGGTLRGPKQLVDINSLIEASSILSRILEDHPESAEARRLNALVLYAKGRELGEVEVELEVAASHAAPLGARIWNDLGVLRCEDGRLEEALAAFETADAICAGHDGECDETDKTIVRANLIELKDRIARANSDL
jgi:hypothetical protein